MKRIIIAAMLLISLALLLLTAPPSQAQSRYLVRLIDQYPHLTDSRLNDCRVCHEQGVSGGATNSFAEDYFNKGFNFSNIEEFDSDGDGFTNLEEIEAASFPGNPRSVPRTTNRTPVEPEPTPLSLSDLLSDKTSQERATFLYTAYCSSCHGAYSENGQLTNLRHLPSNREAHIRTTITAGLPNTTMPAWSETAGGSLSAEHIDDLTALLIGWYAPPTPTAVPTIAPTPTVAPTPLPPNTFTMPPNALLNLTVIFTVVAVGSFILALWLLKQTR